MLQSMGSQRPRHNRATELNFPPLSSSSTAHAQEVNKCNWRGSGSWVLAGGLGREGSGWGGTRKRGHFSVVPDTAPPRAGPGLPS